MRNADAAGSAAVGAARGVVRAVADFLQKRGITGAGSLVGFYTFAQAAPTVRGAVPMLCFLVLLVTFSVAMIFVRRLERAMNGELVIAFAETRPAEIRTPASAAG